MVRQVRAEAAALRHELAALHRVQGKSAREARALPEQPSMVVQSSHLVQHHHLGTFRRRPRGYACSLEFSESSSTGPLCTHPGGVLRFDHWSCCGARNEDAPCSVPSQLPQRRGAFDPSASLLNDEQDDDSVHFEPSFSSRSSDESGLEDSGPILRPLGVHARGALYACAGRALIDED